MPNIVTPAAVNNAIANAIGARFYELPIDSEFVWRTIQEMTKK
jgi:CO/xanthine dehydrogenase Mo-binding subunit